MDTRRRTLPHGVLAVVLILLVFLFLLLLVPTVHSALARALGDAALPSAGASAAGEVQTRGELTAIDVPAGAQAVLHDLGLLYQGEARDGLLRAAGTQAQLAALRQQGVSFSEVGPVLVFQGSQDSDGSTRLRR